MALSPLVSSDLETLFEWINDRDLVLFNGPYLPISMAEHRDWFEATQRRSDVAIFGIRCTEDDALIGSCQLHSINQIHRSAELRGRIGLEEHRNRGMGSEALRLLLRFAFDDLNLHRIALQVLATNTAAVHVYEKLGFVHEGALRLAAHVDGRYVDVLMMGLLSGERSA